MYIYSYIHIHIYNIHRKNKKLIKWRVVRVNAFATRKRSKKAGRKYHIAIILSFSSNSFSVSGAAFCFEKNFDSTTRIFICITHVCIHPYIYIHTHRNRDTHMHMYVVFLLLPPRERTLNNTILKDNQRWKVLISRVENCD